MKCKKLAFIAFILDIVIMLSLSSCSDNHMQNIDDELHIPGDYEIQVSDYVLSGSEDGYYISSSTDYSQKYDNINIQMSSEIHFDSMKSFVEAVTNGTLTDSQKSIIFTQFPNDEKGILTCDFENLQEAILPECCTSSTIIWTGEVYAHNYMSSVDESVFGNVIVYPEHTYEEIYERDYVNKYNNTNINVTETKSLNERNATAYCYKTQYSKMMSIHYTLQREDKNFIVVEDYMLQTTDMAGEWVSDVIPYRIKMYCTDGHNFFVVNIYHPIERPSEEWLLSFGLKDYE